jgi:hypothetical protein
MQVAAQFKTKSSDKQKRAFRDASLGRYAALAGNHDAEVRYGLRHPLDLFLENERVRSDASCVRTANNLGSQWLSDVPGLQRLVARVLL